jgi:hypothetical protein
MKAILLLLLVPFLGTAYADTVEIDTEFPIAYQECTKYFAPQNPAIQMMTCTWQNVQFVEADQQFSLTPYEAPKPEKVCAEGLVLNEETGTCDEVFQEKIPLTKDERIRKALDDTILRLEAKEDLRSTDSELLRLLKELNYECYQGRGGTAAFQPFDFWDVPFEIKELPHGEWRISIPGDDPKKSFDVRGNDAYGKIKMKAQACKAQNTLEFQITPGHYEDFVVGAADFQLDHRDAIPVETQPNWIDRKDSTTTQQELRADSWICSNANVMWDSKTKLDYCESLEPVEQKLPNPDKFIQTFASPLDEHKKYRLTCGLFEDTSHIIDDRVWNYLEMLQDDTQWSCPAGTIQEISELDSYASIAEFLRNMGSEK